MPALYRRFWEPSMVWLLSTLRSLAFGYQSFVAQVAPTPKPFVTPPTVDAATIEFLKGQFQSLTTTFNIYVTLLSTIAALFVGFAAWFFKRTLSEAKQEVQQLVREAVKLEIAASIKQRIETLEQLLEREEVPGLVSVDYVLQMASGSLPKEHRLLHARFPKLKVRRLDSRQFNGDVVVLDLVTYQPTLSSLPKADAEAELTRLLDDAIDKLSPESVLVVYIEGQYDAIKHLGKKLAYYASANVPTQLLGNVVNAAYVARTLHGEH